MFYIYVLKSLKDDELYIGYTENLKRRMLEHAKGSQKATDIRLPFQLIYYESYASKADAKDKEKSLKDSLAVISISKDALKIL